MTTLDNIIQMVSQTRFATEAGVAMHRNLQRVTIASDHCSGDSELVARIVKNKTLAQLFSPQSRTEVPIAGTINGHFVSRRLDRLLINNTEKTIMILDYKTDTAPDKYRTQYISQVYEYMQLLHAIYPNYTVHGYILWTHDFSLEKIPTKPL